MFQNRSAASSYGVIGTSVSLLIAVVIATGLNIWLTVEIRKEQRAVNEIVRGGVQEDIQRLGALPAELGWQLLFTVVVLVVLVVSAITLLFVVRAYLKSQAALRDTVTLTRDMLESIDYGVITTDTDGTLTTVNREACHLLDFEDKPLRQPISTAVSLDTPLAGMCEDVLTTGKDIHDREFHVGDQDHGLDLRADCHTIRGMRREKRGTVLHIRDVTQRKLLEQRMRRMERFMGLGTLAAGLHHEIKNPLSALSLHVQLLEEEMAGQENDPVQENFNVIKAEVTRIAGVLESFRDYASTEQLNEAPVDLQDIVQRTAALIGPQAKQQNVGVNWKSEPAALPTVIGDAIRLEQVLLNLTINALEAMPKGGQLSLSSSSADGQVVISVSDTGPGIPNHVKGFILDPYFTTKGSGSGMGLAFCDKIVRLHGGQLSFDTSPNGTQFHVALPTANDDE